MQQLANTRGMSTNFFKNLPVHFYLFTTLYMIYSMLTEKIPNIIMSKRYIYIYIYIYIYLYIKDILKRRSCFIYYTKGFFLRHKTNAAINSTRDILFHLSFIFFQQTHFCYRPFIPSCFLIFLKNSFFLTRAMADTK